MNPKASMVVIRARFNAESEKTIVQTSAGPSIVIPSGRNQILMPIKTPMPIQCQFSTCLIWFSNRTKAPNTVNISIAKINVSMPEAAAQTRCHSKVNSMPIQSDLSAKFGASAEKIKVPITAIPQSDNHPSKNVQL